MSLGFSLNFLASNRKDLSSLQLFLFVAIISEFIFKYRMIEGGQEHINILIRAQHGFFVLWI